MPLYEYKCEICKTVFESIEHVHTEIVVCDKCLGFADRIMSSCNFKVNGSNAKNGYTISSADKFIKQGIK